MGGVVWGRGGASAPWRALDLSAVNNMRDNVLWEARDGAGRQWRAHCRHPCCSIIPSKCGFPQKEKQGPTDTPFQHTPRDDSHESTEVLSAQRLTP